MIIRNARIENAEELQDIRYENGVFCELRSNKHNINPIAVKYGGGGHAKASGATLKDRAEAMRMLEDLNQFAKEKPVQ